MGMSDSLDERFASRPGRRSDTGPSGDEEVDGVVADDDGRGEGRGSPGRADLRRWDRRDLRDAWRRVVATDAFRWAAVGAVIVLVAAALWLRRDGRPVDDLLPMASDGGTASSAPSAASGPPVGGGADGVPTSEVPGPIVVHVAGQVVDPGVIEIEDGARVADAVAAAGGPTAFADLDRLNLAAPLADGQRVGVAAIGDPPDRGGVSDAAGARGASGTKGESVLIDVNRDDESELEELPGVGPATAAAIVSHREEHGPFGSVDELIDVRGIGPAKLEAIAETATVGP